MAESQLTKTDQTGHCELGLKLKNAKKRGEFCAERDLAAEVAVAVAVAWSLFSFFERDVRSPLGVKAGDC